jgi:hypothetical protein
MRSHAGIRRWAAMLLLVGGSACAHGNQTGAEDFPPEPPVGVYVRNENFLDMDVFAVLDNSARRLGTVPGNSSGSFTLRWPGAHAQGISVRAVPIGGGGLYQSGVVSLGSDQIVDLHIAPVLRQSVTTVRDTL